MRLMTAIAREPLVAPFPSGRRERDCSSPKAAQHFPAEFTAPTASEPAHAQRPFLHVLTGNATGTSQTAPIDPPSTISPLGAPHFRVDLRDRPIVSGTVLTSDVCGPATPYLSEISFEGTSFAVPKERSLQVPGNFGMLSISASGAFSYKRAETTCGFVDAFVCTARAAGDAPPVRITLEILSSDNEDELRSLVG
jgi:hypothetical protein